MAYLGVIEGVIHVAGLLPSCATTQEMLDAVNVDGAALIVQSCKAHSVRFLVATSSASVVMNVNDKDINGKIGEDMPYPSSPGDYIDGYALSKAAGEKVILSANNEHGLSTVCLRPAIIYSADDGKLAEGILRGGLEEMIGDGSNVIDFVWSDTVASAHVRAYSELQNPDSVVAGKAYHISHGKPCKVGEFFCSEHWKMSRPRKVPFGLVLFFAHINLAVFRAVRVAPFDFYLRPDSIKFMAGRNWWFSISRAEQDFGFQPLKNVQETIKYMRRQVDQRPH